MTLNLFVAWFGALVIMIGFTLMIRKNPGAGMIVFGIIFTINGGMAVMGTPKKQEQQESNVQTACRIEAARAGCYLWRNNSGAFHDEKSDRWVRYGLGNDSKRINEVFKSSDLIGVRPVRITPEMVGQTIGVFVAAECKPEGWKGPSANNEREVAQNNFINTVRAAGGFAGFVTSTDELLVLLRCR